MGRTARPRPLGYHTTPHSATNESPFFLTFGSEAVIPVKIGEPSWRVENFNEEKNGPTQREDMDLLEEVREVAYVKETTAKQRAQIRFNSKVIPRRFNLGDLVLRRANVVNRNTTQGKLAQN